MSAAARRRIAQAQTPSTAAVAVEGRPRGLCSLAAAACPLLPEYAAMRGVARVLEHRAVRRAVVTIRESQARRP